MQTIQCGNIFYKAVNNHLSNQSGHETRIWYHKTAAIKECQQVPFLSFSPPYRAIFLFALYPIWEPRLVLTQTQCLFYYFVFLWWSGGAVRKIRENAAL